MMIPAVSLIGSVVGAVTGTPSLQSAERSGATMPGADFGQVLSSVSKGVIDDLKAGESASISGLQGKASVQQVVESVSQAQQSLQIALAIRDKVVSAYQSMSQMAI
jgi:flagellar hook-basal body complex protein FliE